jgi:hypothetical protein
MSIVLVGSTSGSVTLQEPAVAGTTVLDLPAVSGTVLTTGSSGQSIPKAALPTGSVLQVVNAATTTSTSTTSATAVTTALTASITPLYSSSKILITVFANGIQKNSGNSNSGVLLYLYKNGSNLQKFGDFVGYTNSSQTNAVGTAGLQYLDSPATTSSITYTIYIASNVSGQTVYINAGADYSTITLMEIAA